MPELPEVEIVKRGLEKAIDGCVLTNIDQRRPDLRIPFPDNLESRVRDKKVNSLERRGKYIKINLSDDQVLVIHLGMSGRVLIIPDDDNYKPEKHDHLILGFNNGCSIIYNDARRFGMVMLIDSSEIETHPSFSKMGPEPLGNEFNGDVLAQRLSGKKVPIKNALLDQRIVAGVGNIYACEALFMYAIDPQRPSSSLNNKECNDLSCAIREVLELAIDAGGSTLKDYRHTDGELGYFQHSFAVYDREGVACRGCTCDVSSSGGIKKIVQGGRSTYFCPNIQK